MTPKITTKNPVNYSASNPFAKGIIEIALVRWIETDGVYTAITQDFLKESQEIQRPNELEPETIVKFTAIGEEEPHDISEDKYNNLSMYAKSVMPKNLTPYQEQEFKKKIGLLATINSDFFQDENGVSTGKLKYNTTPSDWEIVN